MEAWLPPTIRHPQEFMGTLRRSPCWSRPRKLKRPLRPSIMSNYQVRTIKHVLSQCQEIHNAGLYQYRLAEGQNPDWFSNFSHQKELAEHLHVEAVLLDPPWPTEQVAD